MREARLAAVSAIVVVRNGERYLRDALESIRAQSLAPCEILVVDGRSTDGTVAIARAYAAVRVVEQTELGLAHARNLAIRAAQGEYVAFLDHDDRWLPEKLRRQQTLMEGNRALEYTTTLVTYRVEPDAPAGFVKGRSAAPFEAATPSCLMARRGLFESVGLFDPHLAVGCDSDWFARCRDLNVPTAVVAEPLVEKRLHAGNLSRNAAVNRRDMFELLRASLKRGGPVRP